MTDRYTELWKSLQELSEAEMEFTKQYETEVDALWESTPYEDKLKYFYAIVKRIHKAEILDQGTYRYALYEVFGFGPEAYGLGMDCGFMCLHNSIFPEKNIDR